MTSPSSSAPPSGAKGKSSAVALTATGKNIELGKYRITRLLGQGGFGITYLAQVIETGQEVVVKENLPTDFMFRNSRTLQVVPMSDELEADCRWAMDNFLHEARLLKQLDHPNIVKVQDAFSALGTAYYVMPWVGGNELGQAAPAPGTITEEWLAPILRQLLEALQYLHDKNLLHRDIKPSNILMSEGGEPVLIDFGAARSIISEKSATKVGSPGYTPIEQVQSKGKRGSWTDLYALGATCYRLITGHRPPQCEDRIDEEDDEYRPLAPQAELYSRFSHEFLAAIDKALAVRGKNRWQKAEEWLATLPKPKPIEPPTPEPIIITPGPQPNPEPVPTPPAPAPAPAGMPLYGKILLVAMLLLLLGGGRYAHHVYSDMQNKMEARAMADAEAMAEAEAARQVAEGEIARLEAEAEAARLAANKAKQKANIAEAQAEAYQQAAEKAKRQAAEAEETRKAAEEAMRPHAISALTAQGISSSDYNKKLRSAADEGNLELVQLLLTAGANVNTADTGGWTPLHYAAYKGHKAIALVLIDKGANIEAKQKDGATPLYIAAVRGHTETALALIDKGANMEAGNNNNATPLYIAAQNGHTETVRALIDKGANIEAKTNRGYTPLHFAAYNGHSDIVRLLLEHGANRSAKDSSGETALDWAREKGHTAIVELLR